MLIVDRFSERPGGAPVPLNTPVLLKRVADDSLIETQNTDLDGFVRFEMNGSPGPIYLECTVGTQTYRRYGTCVSQVGSWFEADWTNFMKLIASGIVKGVGDGLLVVPGGGMQVQIGTGLALGSGLMYSAADTDLLTIAANGAGQPRIDVVGIQFYTDGVLVGACAPIIVQGTPAATPVTPTYSGPVATSFVPLALVRVNAGAALIQASDITDVRLYATAVAPDSITSSHIQNGTITGADLADGIITTAKLADNSVTAAKIVDGTIGTSELANGAVTPEKLSLSWVPIIQSSDSDTDQDYSGANQIITTVTIAGLAAGTYKWMAWALTRITDKNSSAAPRGWLGIHWNGGEQSAEFFYLPGGFGDNGDSVQVQATSQFTGSGTQTFTLRLSMDQGIATVNQRSLMVWVQRIA